MMAKDRTKKLREAWAVLDKFTDEVVEAKDGSLDTHVSREKAYKAKDRHTNNGMLKIGRIAISRIWKKK
jgi:hypothetical protein